MSRFIAINVATVTSIDKIVDRVRTISNLAQSDDRTFKLPITPTPAGTNIKDKWARITCVVGRRALAKGGLRARAASKITKPKTGPGIGRPNPRAINSPAS